MKTNFAILPILVLLLGLNACTKEIFRVETDLTSPAMFRHIWRDYAENYGLFAVRQIDWDSVYRVHEPQINAQTTTAQLYAQLTDMLRTLNDRHVSLYPASNPELPTWSIDLTNDGTYVLEDFNWEVVKTHYIDQLQEVTPFLQFGTLQGQIGYLHLLHFDGKRKEYETGLDAALNALSELPGLIIDIRDNTGGYDPNAQYTAGRFAATAALYMMTRKKNGPGPNDFAETREWTVAPTGRRQFTKPIIVLAGSSTASAAETFLLALKTQAHIRQMGTTTAGSFSDNPAWEAPNGWMYTISVGDFRAADGRSYEGKGLTPDIMQESRKADWLQGKDLVLEKALELLQ